MKDIEAVLKVYDRYLEARPEQKETSPRAKGESQLPLREFRLEEAVWQVVRYIEARGFFFEPWQVAQYVTALRTKPFVILAGITGTGKSKLPALIGEATGSEVRLVPVRPDWTDSSDALGYVDLQGNFRAGQVLEVIRAAQDEDDRFWVCIIDEMNLARVEQYFAEILSRIEERSQSPRGGFRSPPLITYPLKEEDADWGNVGLPTNLALVGTVNMDETTHGFSRKVLDRAFTVELSDVELGQWHVPSPGGESIEAVTWPVEAWQPRAVRLGALTEVSEEDREEIERVVKALMEVNRFLTQAQLQVGYRTRDEIALFLLHARDLKSAFVTRSGDQVDPLDLALQMKILPRIIGGSAAVRRAVVQMLGWAFSGSPYETEEEARTAVREWAEAGRPGAVPSGRFPRTAARLCLMFERFEEDGFTSFWL
jgi:5-methylcytosine-specific restriction endonuclease McrBC GTP-binding regulatory subunit McrB